MSKNKGKKKKEEAPVIQDYHPEEIVNSLNIQFKEEEKDIEDLIEKLTKKNRDFEIQAKKYKEEALSVSKILEKNTKTNEYLKKNLKKLRKKKK